MDIKTTLCAYWESCQNYIKRYTIWAGNNNKKPLWKYIEGVDNPSKTTIRQRKFSAKIGISIRWELILTNIWQNVEMFCAFFSFFLREIFVVVCNQLTSYIRTQTDECGCFWKMETSCAGFLYIVYSR